MAKELLSTRPIEKLRERRVIPMELRKELGWQGGNRISVYTRGIDVLLSKPSSTLSHKLKTVNLLAKLSPE